MKNIDEKIKKLQELKQVKIDTYQKVYDFINNFEVPKELQSEFKIFAQLINNAIARRVKLSTTTTKQNVQSEDNK